MKADRFRKEYLGRIIITFFGILIILITLTISYFLIQKGIQTFTVLKYPVLQFLTGSKWSAQFNPNDPKGQVGSLVFIVGTIVVSCLALVIATPFALICGIFITEISPRLGKKFLQPAIEIFVGIPSVVYGWLGYTVLCPAVKAVFHLEFYGFSVLAAGIVLSVMIFPTIATVTADSIRNLPDEFREASYALGSTRWQMLRHVNLPAATSGILTGIILGLARAFGEALAVSMVIGNQLTMPKNILSQTSTLTTMISNNMGSSVNGTGWTDGLWTMGLMLFVISFLCILIIRLISGRKRRYG